MGCDGHSVLVEKSLSGLSPDPNCLFSVRTPVLQLGDSLENIEIVSVDNNGDYNDCENDVVEHRLCTEPATLFVNSEGNTIDQLSDDVVLCCTISNSNVEIENSSSTAHSSVRNDGNIDSGVDHKVDGVGSGGQEDASLSTVLSVTTDQMPNSGVGVDQSCCLVNTKQSLEKSEEFQCDDISEVFTSSGETVDDQHAIVEGTCNITPGSLDTLMIEVSHGGKLQCEDGKPSSTQYGETCSVLSPMVASMSKCTQQDENAKMVITSCSTVKDDRGTVENKQNILTETSTYRQGNSEEILAQVVETPLLLSPTSESPSKGTKHNDNIEILIRSDETVKGCQGIAEEERNLNKSTETVDTNSVSLSACNDIVHALPGQPRRTTRRRNLNKSTETRKVGRRRMASNKTLFPCSAAAMSLDFTRGKRSCLSKPARSSIWGTLENIVHAFPENDGTLNQDSLSNQIVRQGSQKRKGGQSGKRMKSARASGNSRMSKGRRRAITGCVTLKVNSEEDKEERNPEIVVPCDMDPLPSAQIALAASPATKDTLIGNTLGDCPGVFSESATKNMGEAVDLRYSDPGTSPDSEVINVILDADIAAGAQGDLCDSVLSYSEKVDPVDVKTSNMKIKIRTKGKQKGKVKGPHSLGGSPAAEEKFSAHRNPNSTRKSAKCRNGLRGEEKLQHTDTVISATSENVSLNLSCIAGSHTKSPSVLGLGEHEEGLQADTVLDSCEFSGHFLPVSETANVKLPKCAKPSAGLGKCKSRAPDSARCRSANARQKKNVDSLTFVNKSKVKGDDALAQVASKDESHLETDTNLNICLPTGKHLELRGPPDMSNVEILGPSTLDGQGNLNFVEFSEEMLKPSLASNALAEQFWTPPNAWVSCDDCQKWRCISAALADSINETNRHWTCKDNVDKAFADCSIPQEKSNAEINAELEISGGSGEEDVRDKHSVPKVTETKQLTVSKPATWSRIKSNLFLHRKRKTQTIDEIMVCHCKPPQDGQLGCGDECLNRMLNIECVHGTCPCGDFCSNQQFQKRKYAKFKWLRTGKKGFGLQLQQNVSEGAFLIEYVGEVLDLHTYEVRQKEYASIGQKHFYFMTLNGSEVIDACAKGNLGRFINHSCDPNCRTEKWMVNGEVCIGLFAQRDIKKGEEVTFDYNYVRVFGAAAKRCICGSPGCRGYLGGDPLSTEVVVQGDSDDEYPEPLMVPESTEVVAQGDSDDEYPESLMVPETTDSKVTDSCLPDAHVKPGEGRLDTSSTIDAPPIAQLQIPEEMECSRDGSLSSARQVDISVQAEDNTSRSPSDLHNGDSTSKSSLGVQPLQISLEKDETTSTSSSMVQPSGASNSATSPMRDRKCTFETVEEKQHISKSQSLVRSSRSVIPIRKGKSSSHTASTSKPRVSANKHKNLVQGPANNGPEGVEDKLNELLDFDGGISKKKDATKGYLKLLFVTAASGDNVKGEAVQSTRDLSIILDALLKTKSKTVLSDIISKNGLQMLHNIMKQNRRNFNKTPIIRKLLKVVEYLADKKILTVDHIISGPPCVGVESFRESMLELTRHNDVQVHQIARIFRDTYIPRQYRRINFSNRENSGPGAHGGSSFSRSAPYKRWNDRGAVRASEATNADMCTETFGLIMDGHPINGEKSRKRKSRWDQPKDSQPPDIIMKDCSLNLKKEVEIHQDQSELRINRENNMGNVCDQSLLTQVGDPMMEIHEDAPPGFSAPFSSNQSVPSNTSSTTTVLPSNTGGLEVVVGCLQSRYISHLPVSFGIPVSFVEQLGTPTQAGTTNSWVVAPSIPFHSFPPLPKYPRDKSIGGCKEEYCESRSAETSTSGARQPNVTANNEHQMNGGQNRWSSGGGNLGRGFFRQRKWNNSCRTGRPWVTRRNDRWRGGSKESNNTNNISRSLVAQSVNEKNEVVNGSNLYRSQGVHGGNDYQTSSSNMYQQHP